MTLFQMQIKTYQVIFIGNPYSMHVQARGQITLDELKTNSTWITRDSLDKMRK